METQQTIAEWARETFGEVTPLRQAVRTHEEMSELLKAVVAGEPAARLIEEAADVMICLQVTADLCGQILTWTIHHRGRDARIVRGQAFHANAALSRVLMWLYDDATPDSLGNAPAFGWLLDECARCLAQVAYHCGSNLGQAVAAKMQTNRARQWRTDATGCGYHVDAEPA